MDQDVLLKSWQQEEQRPFTGWDFSYLDGRMLEEQPPWSYSKRAANLMTHVDSVIDMGTAGGERLLKLQPHWPERVVATEEYPPNIKLATERLAPLGVRVKDVRLTDYDPMPFADDEFDLVINRHAPFNPQEVARILSVGGTFLTQQVHGLWAHDLLAAFGAKPQWPDATPAHYLPLLKAAGLSIINLQEWSGRLTFTDVAAIVYYLKAVPWLVPGFSVSSHSNNLLQLQYRLNQDGVLAFEAKKYMIEASKK